MERSLGLVPLPVGIQNSFLFLGSSWKFLHTPSGFRIISFNQAGGRLAVADRFIVRRFLIVILEVEITHVVFVAWRG